MSALMVSDFPPSPRSDFEDILVEYLEVCIPKEQEQLEGKDLLDVSFKSEGSASDSDSGRGSCDSHTLLTDKCGEAKEDTKEEGRAETGDEALAGSCDSMSSPGVCNGRVKTWPSVFSSSPQNGTDMLDRQRSLVMARHHYPSDNLLPPGSAASYVAHPGHGALRPAVSARGQLHSRSDVDISSIGIKRAPGELLPQTDPSAADGCPQVGRYYSKVKGVDRGNLLLLQREENDKSGNDAAKGGCSTHPAATATKAPASTVGEEITLTSGYVDTATICMLNSQ